MNIRERSFLDANGGDDEIKLRQIHFLQVPDGPLLNDGQLRKLSQKLLRQHSGSGDTTGAEDQGGYFGCMMKLSDGRSKMKSQKPYFILTDKVLRKLLTQDGFKGPIKRPVRFLDFLLDGVQDCNSFLHAV